LSEEAKIVEERLLVIPLKRAYYYTRWRRVEKAVKLLKEKVAKHMKAKEVKLSTAVNEALWSRGAQKPPRRLEVKAVKDEDGVVWVRLQSEETS